jgi:putative transcriptional regulator
MPSRARLRLVLGLRARRRLDRLNEATGVHGRTMHRCTRILVRAAWLLGFAAVGLAQAQQSDPANGLLLVAKPSLSDPNFGRTVVLVTQTPDASTVGVVLNRPTTQDLAQFLAPDARAHNYRDSVYWGGPVMPQVIVALFRADTPPPAAAFHVHKGLYLSMDPRNVQALLEASAGRYRLYTGFAGWLPGQLALELARDDWYLLPVDEEILFRQDTSRLWEELAARAGETHAGIKAQGRPGAAVHGCDEAGSRCGDVHADRRGPRALPRKTESPA